MDLTVHRTIEAAGDAVAARAVAAFHAPGALARATRSMVDWDQGPAAEVLVADPMIRLVGECGRQP